MHECSYAAHYFTFVMLIEVGRSSVLVVMGVMRWQRESSLRKTVK